MLKEEKELRKYLCESVTDDYPDEFKEIRKEWSRLITALVRAVREDCAKDVDAIAEKWKFSKASCFAREVAATIRRKG